MEEEGTDNLYREAEWRCSSGEWRAAPFDAVEHAACRSSRSRPEGSVPGWIPERRNAEPKRGAGRWGKTFWFLLWRLTKGTRRKGETVSGRYRRNGYVHLREIGRLPGRHRWQASSHSWTVYICERLVGYQAAIAGRPAPTVGLCISARDWSAIRPPSRASPLPHLDCVHPREIGRL
jgi:hypothetical protein